MVFGKKIRSTVIGEGKFYCPECRCTTIYRLKRKRQVYTLAFIPVVPLEEIGRYVECSVCGNSFRETVLDSTPETSRAEFHPSMKRIMILMMLADGDISEAEIESIREIYTRVTGNGISREEIEDEVSVAKKENGRVGDYLRKVTPYLNNAGKEQVLKSAFYVATADGIFQEEEASLMEEISHALDMEPTDYRHLMSVLREASAVAVNDSV